MESIGRARSALIVVDVQMGFDHMEQAHGRRNNRDAVSKIAQLLGAFREIAGHVFHIRHQGTSPQSFFRPDGPGFLPIASARELPGEPVIVKNVNSAFIGTDLESRLRALDVQTLIVCGATTNHCVETTCRMAGNLGFDTLLVTDATWTFDRRGPDGRVHRAEDIQAMTESNLADEFAQIVSTQDVLERLCR